MFTTKNFSGTFLLQQKQLLTHFTAFFLSLPSLHALAPPELSSPSSPESLEIHTAFSLTQKKVIECWMISNLNKKNYRKSKEGKLNSADTFFARNDEGTDSTQKATECAGTD